MKVDFEKVVDCIFKSKSEYYKLTDKNKEDFFWIINRKFGVEYPDLANKLSSKHIDKASALDIWFEKFKNARSIPSWYWSKSTPKDKEDRLTKSERTLLLENTNLTNEDIDFMIKNYFEDLEFEIKKFKRLE